MTAVSNTPAHARLMDDVYRYQRHFYDVTRKFYLLGRDQLIDALNVPSGANVLELGCGTGRNLSCVAARYPGARIFGLDISRAMLATAQKHMHRQNIDGRVTLAQGDASAFEPDALFGKARFERVFFSYTLSMIPPWEQTIVAALESVAPGGSLHIVDFGQQERLPRWFRAGLRKWLATFHVAPRDSLRKVLESACENYGASLRFDSLFRGYAIHAVITLPHED